MSEVSQDDANAAAVDLRDLHCRTLQAEIERQAGEIARLQRRLAEAQVAALRSGNDAPAGSTGPMRAGASAGESGAGRFLMAWATRLLLEPTAARKRLNEEAELSRSLEAALAACRDTDEARHFTRVHDWAARV